MKKLLIILLLVVPVAAFGQLDTINIGSSANSGTGESLRSAMLKVNNHIDTTNLLHNGPGWHNLYLANGAVIDFNAGSANITHTANQDEIVVTGNLKITQRLEPESIYVTSTGADISQTELDALDGVTGGEAMTTESLTDAVVITVGDTTVTAVVGKIVFKTSDSHFYGCKATTGHKWFQLDN